MSVSPPALAPSGPPAVAPPRRSSWHGPLLFAATALVFVWAQQSTGLDLGTLAESGPRVADFLLRMWPPDTQVLPIVVRATVETLHIALLGTAASVVVSIVLGILAAGSVTPSWVHVPLKTLLAGIRGVPLILVAMLMVGAVGLGPTPGIFAIALHSTGMLGKFYSESFENVSPGPLSALESAGAGWLQALRFGAWPQIAPDIVRDTLFRFELNLRDSLVLGLVGAGGIGFYIQTYIRAFQYEKVATLTLVVLALVILIEGVNHLVRKSLR
jgi:phosphonate transport system permease protein